MMRWLLLIGMFIGCSTIGQSIDIAPIGQDTLHPVITFDKANIELGKIKKGSHPAFKYHYTNTGNEPIQIEFISLCNCTEAEYSTDPLQPGEKGVIDVVFITENKEDKEPVTLDVMLTNKEPGTDIPIIVTLTYTFEFIE